MKSKSLSIDVATSALLAWTTASAQQADGPRDQSGRLVSLDTRIGRQIPPRDASKLPSDFEGAAKTQPADPNWGKVADGHIQAIVKTGN